MAVRAITNARKSSRSCPSGRSLPGEAHPIAATAPWPKFDAAMIVENEIVMPVQINGKKRGDLTIARDADQATIQQAVLELDFVKAALEGGTPKKIIVVPQRIVNVVA